MTDNRNRGSPRLQFTKEELENDALSRPIEKAEKAADRYDAARKKLKKHYRLKLNRAETDENSPQPSRTERGNTEPSASEARNTPDGIQTDPKAPGVRNTRQKQDAKKNDPAQRKPGKKTESVTAEASNEPSSVSGDKKKGIRLRFEETDPKKHSVLSHPVQKMIRTAGDQLHRQAVQANEDDNVAVDAMLKADDVKESVLQTGERLHHSRSLRHSRRVAKAEKKLDRANIQFLEARYRQEHPQFTSNPLSRWQQKRAIRKEYAAAKRGEKTTIKTVKSAEQTVEKTGKAAARTASAIGRHPSTLAILALGALLLFITTGLQSCAPLVESLLGSVSVGSYPAKEEDVLAAEQAYLEMEKALKDELEHYDQYHPGYDEYYVDADEIGHDPYVLIAIISACFDGEEWDIDSAMPVIEEYFNRQYKVTETITKRTFRDDDGVLQTRTVCTVTMESENLSHLPVATMTHHTLGMYALYMSTHGNMEGIFTGPYATPLKEPMLYDIPQDTLDADPTFAKLMEEASKYIGFPYVWGGSDPETSFDCSGFICYVFTNTGICNTGRLGAKGIRSLCRDVPEDQVRPGDIVFFDGTMGDGVEGVTHCGIYVGNNMMIHCGSPISYADLTDSYWQKHFHSYGRMPH